MANGIPFIAYIDFPGNPAFQRAPQVGDVVCMTSDVENHATSPFATSVIEAIKPHKDYPDNIQVHLARPHAMVNSIGSCFIRMEQYTVEMSMFVERFVAHSGGTKIDNVQR